MTSLPPILQILPALGDGGVERSALEMATALSQKAWPNLVVADDGNLAPHLAPLGTPHIMLPLSRKNPFLLPWNIYHLRRLFMSHPGAIVHVRSRWPAWCAWLAWCLTPKAARGFFVSTFHGTYSHDSALKRVYNRVMLKGTVIANSQFIRDHISQVYSLSPHAIAVAPRGVDETRFSPAALTPAERHAARALWPEDCENRFLCVGRLTRWKGQLLLLEALTHLSTSLLWHLVIVGDSKEGDPYKQEILTFIETHNLTSRVTLAGSRSDIPALNDAATLAFSPSIRPEAFGRVAIEAMAMGTPVIATALGGSKETIQHGQTGWLVHVQHPTVLAGMPQALAQTIETALTTPPKTLKKMGEDARAHVVATYTTARTCAAEIAVYQRLIAGHGLTQK
ncbi:MAG: glycosyl transferase [Alphaproteobacteria bacterium CG_4_10_14_0_8_um_filter_53_9]|nr:MAG: glycosyl transferase [Alphaproteobacteria bacterium CG_4_10_14_0_8_um_filter_53_9]